MHKYELLVLNILKKHNSITFSELEKKSSLGKDELLWSIENLSNLSLLDLTYKKNNSITLSQEGMLYSKSMLPEDEIINSLQSGKEIKASQLLLDKERIGMQWCIKKGLILIKNGMLSLTKKGEEYSVPSAESIFLSTLHKKSNSTESFSSKELSYITEFSSRKLIEVKEKNTIDIIKISKKGAEAIIEESENSVDQIDRELILSKSWESKKFKKYDVSIPVQQQILSMRHPLRLLLNDVKNTFSRLGFTEISGPIIEPSFWVFDSLFVPQDHPAREAQDTFHLSNPSKLQINDKEHLKSIMKSHIDSWKIKWSQEEAESAVLRTQMTSVSVHYIREFMKKYLSGEEVVLPQKLFTVGRVFRNENIDYKHLTDFYQCDGIMIGKNLTMANLFDTLTNFYKSFGVKIRFKPAYFPFVEPGAEIFAQIGENGNWLEIGGSGIIRREVTGISRRKINVLAWGLSIERMLLINNYGIKSIVEPYSSGLSWLRTRKLR